jgi:hypothetical protein
MLFAHKAARGYYDNTHDHAAAHGKIILEYAELQKSGKGHK